MDYEFRVVVEKVAIASQKVIKRDTLKIYDIKQPKSILDLGLRHEEQISLLSKRLYEKWIAVLNQANRLTINRIIEM